MEIDWTKVREGFTTMAVLKEENKELKEEIERLNNIIDEIHKLLHDSYKELSSYLPTDDNCELMSRIANMIGKIKELQERIDKAIRLIVESCITSNEWAELDNHDFIPTGNITYKSLSSAKVKELLITLGSDKE